MSVKTLPRQFKYGSLTLEDPNPDWTVEEVKEHYSQVYQDLISATVEGPEVTETALVYEFEKAYRTKGITIEEIAAGREPQFEEIRVTERQLKLMRKVTETLATHAEDSDFVLPPSEAQGMI